jgi:hypothetical protein
MRHGLVLLFTASLVFAAGTIEPTSAANPVLPLAAAVLPASRSVQVGVPATAFATILNAGNATASAVGIGLAANIPAIFKYNATNCTTNAVIGGDNVPQNIVSGGQGCYVISITPTSPFSPVDVAFTFGGTNTIPVAPLVAINTLLLTASIGPVPDIVALAATPSGDGIVNISLVTGNGVFAVATVNLGATGMITVTANTGFASLPFTIFLCQTDPVTSQCISAIGPSVTTTINAGDTPTFGLLLTQRAVVPFDPVNNRIFVVFTDGNGVTRGATSVAVRTL